MRYVTSAAGLLAVLMVSACATTPPPPPPEAVQTLATDGCVSSPSLTGALSLTPEKKRAYYGLSTLVDAKSGCLVIDGVASRYVLYALPNSPENHTVSVGGRQETLRTFATSVSLLDVDGKVTRRFADDRYAVLGNMFGIQFKPQTTERYVLVQSNPALVGKNVSTFETRMTANSGYAYNPATGYGSSYQTYHGVENKMNRVFSHEGYVDITVQAATGMVGLPNEK